MYTEVQVNASHLVLESTLDEAPGVYIWTPTRCDLVVQDERTPVEIDTVEMDIPSRPHAAIYSGYLVRNRNTQEIDIHVDVYELDGVDQLASYEGTDWEVLANPFIFRVEPNMTRSGSGQLVQYRLRYRAQPVDVTVIEEIPNGKA